MLALQCEKTLAVIDGCKGRWAPWARGMGQSVDTGKGKNEFSPNNLDFIPTTAFRPHVLEP